MLLFPSCHLPYFLDSYSTLFCVCICIFIFFAGCVPFFIRIHPRKKKWPYDERSCRTDITAVVVRNFVQARNHLSACKLIYVSLSFHFPFFNLHSFCLRSIHIFHSFFSIILLPVLTVFFFFFYFYFRAFFYDPFYKDRLIYKLSIVFFPSYYCLFERCFET